MHGIPDSTFLTDDSYSREEEESVEKGVSVNALSDQ